MIVGGGGAGTALAHDLALRGVIVTLVERGELTSGATGRGMGLLHSGARYATSDRVTAADCVAENKILRRVAAGSFEENDGLMVALSDEEADLAKAFVDACWQSAVPVREVPRNRILAMEPGLSRAARLAVRVSDATMDPLRLTMRFAATARANGAAIRTFSEAVGISMQGRSVRGVRVRDHVAGTEKEIEADLVVNAAGSWAGRVAAMADSALPLEFEAGTMVAFPGRHSNAAIGRLGDPCDGSLAVPVRRQTVFGAAWRDVAGPDEDRDADGAPGRLGDGAAELLPTLGESRVRATWTSVRPVFRGDAGLIEGLSREIRVFDHAHDASPVEGLVTVVGGNTTLMRRVAQVAADLVCQKLDVSRECVTAETPLLPHTEWYAR